MKNKSNRTSQCKIEKVTNFTYFCSKTTHINLSKTLFICKIVTVTMHICTVTVTFYMIFFSLSSPLPCQTLSHPLFNAKKKKKKKKKPTANIHPPSQLTNHHHHHTTNPLQHQFNPNTINPKLMKIITNPT